MHHTLLQPYGDLAKQAVQRFESYEDLEAHEVTIEEREEYEQHIDNGIVVRAGGWVGGWLAGWLVGWGEQ